MQRTQLLHSSILALALAAANSSAHALPVDLGTFSTDPTGNIAVSPDGLSATFSENATVSPVSLSNLAIAVPLGALSLEFSYELTVAAQNEDYFDFYLDDLGAPEFSVGGAAGDSALLFSGTHSVDLAALAGSSAPVIFDLAFGFGDLGLDSELTVSNVEILLIPEPGSLLMIGAGLGILMYGCRGRRRRAPGTRDAADRGRGLQ